MFTVDRDYMKKLERPWRQAVVIKLLGKTISFRVLYSQVELLWKPTGGFDVLDLEYDYFLVKFDCQTDFDKVLAGGPWLIFDHYLTVCPWSPAFSPVNAAVTSTLVWARFPDVSVQYYDEDLLLALTSGLGHPVKVDKNTTLANRGRFARVCVEIDFDKPLVGQIELDGATYHVEYEGLHTICFQCGKYGHQASACSSEALASPVQGNEGLQVDGDGAPIQTQTCDNDVALGRGDSVGATGVSASGSGTNTGNKWGFGSWMVVAKKSRHGPRLQQANASLGGSFQPATNRFASLPVEEDTAGVSVKSVNFRVDPLPGPRQMGCAHKKPSHGLPYRSVTGALIP
ncbi:hypothetical protein K2173_010533 [Erythroxylum novogranatense]|uniref:CCHC-type domain-containing protein n=1 Tax=Erythroxylum novogranatense TaxID=1862640 RepID=A0AAV8TDW2_9ROSI|nr:hypothetical protein K2173_010533 [Erythroxylum novogranatense]